MPTRPRVTNLDGVLNVYKRLRKNVPDGLRLAGRKYAEKVLARSQYYCPVENGDLAATGRVEFNEKPGVDMVYTVSYGGEAPSGKVVDYAVVVHERQDLVHTPPARAGFLAAAFYETYSAGRISLRDAFYSAVKMS